MAAAVGEKGETPEGVRYTIVEIGTGGKAAVGDLVTLKFKGSLAKDGRVFDDIMEQEAPFFTRVGGGLLVPGIDSALKQMRSGDVWDLVIPSNLGFGPEGRKPGPGRPRIGPNAELNYRLKLESIPGKDGDLIDITGGDMTGL